MNKLIKLPIINELKKALSQDLGHIQVILGPRQVGKTTAVLQYLENEHQGPYHYVSADKVFNGSASWLREQWQIAAEKKALLVVDEVQKVVNWAEVIKSQWDANKRNKTRFQCVLLGSSSLDLQKGLTESLTGRFKLIRAHHWNAHESKEGYGLDFEGFLKFGGYPGSYPFLPNTKEWASFVKHSIIETVIEKDILFNHTVKSPGLFKQAFEILVSYPAQEISYTKLLGQLQDKGNTDLIKYYIRLYEGAFLIRTLDKYSGHAVKTRSSSPKILPLAPALFFLNLLDEYSASERGRAFELVVGAQLVRTGMELFYWREKNYEVDYVVKSGRTLWAIEVKSGRQRSALGLEKFKSAFPQAKLLMITPENYPLFESNPTSFLEGIG